MTKFSFWGGVSLQCSEEFQGCCKDEERCSSSYYYHYYCIILTTCSHFWYVCPAEIKTVETITEFVMVLLVIMGLVLVLMETVGLVIGRLLLVAC